MRKRLTTRLIVLSIGWIFLALVATAMMLGWLYRDHIEQHYDAHVFTHVEELIAAIAVDSDGQLSLYRQPTDPRFYRDQSGWYWQVMKGNEIVAHSQSLSDRFLEIQHLDFDENHGVQMMTGPGGHPDNGHHRLTIDIHAAQQPIQSGQWTLELIGRSVVSENGEVHVWVERDRFRAVRFAVEDVEMTLSIPGTAQTVIAVGACNSALPLRLNRSSSWGLTRDGRHKPELCAPGHKILSCWSAQSDLEAVIAKSGTSMAAPHVTGALALALSAREKSGELQWNAVQLRSALIRSVRGLPQRHHLGAGYGLLDTEKLMQLLA